VFEEKQKSKD